MHIAIVGATGAVGRELCLVLEQRQFPIDTISVSASPRSAGQTVPFGGQGHRVAELRDRSFEGVEFAFFVAGRQISEAFAPRAKAAGAVVIDNSSAFRMEQHTPLVIPEVNPQDAYLHQGLIANPNCSTILLATVVWPLHRKNRARRIIVSTYQAVSGAGGRAIGELEEQTRLALAGEPVQPNVLPHPSAFNVFSHESMVDASGYNEEERKIAREIRKIFHDDEIRIAATCVRVPVMRAHCESVHLMFEEPISEGEVREILAEAPGVKVVDDRASNHFPMPIEASGRDEVLVGRIRQDLSDPSGRAIQLFLCGDQLRKGAALNAVQIAELLAEKPKTQNPEEKPKTQSPKPK